jgi:predicted RecA/RadA family phage recombinase
MRSLKLAEKLQQSLRDYLKLEQQNVLEQTGRNVIEAQRKTRSLGAQSFASMEDTTEFDAMMQTGVFQVPTAMLEAMNSGKTPEPKKINQVQALNTGDWINMRKDAEKILAKLAWKAEDSSLFIFVDRDGTRICEVDAEKLADQFESGEVSLLDSAVAAAFLPGLPANS